MANYLYIHIPFCLKKCIYCDFYSITADSSIMDEYVDSLCKEIDMRSGSVSSLEAVYIGGGTPSLLRGRDIKKIMDKLGSVGIADEAEITAEANPGTLSENGIKTMLESGINRISIGVQSLDDKELDILGRIHNSTDAVNAFEIARKDGFENISVDLIYGLPGQQIRDWKQNLARTINLNPEHISTYELTPEKKTPLFDSLSNGRLRMPDEETIATMYYLTIDTLNAAGYNHYEISNFAKTGFECRHNLNYWDRGEYVGIGAAAHSLIDGKRSSNINDVKTYIAEIKRGMLPVNEETQLTSEDSIKEMLFLGLRKTAGVDLRLFPEEEQTRIKEALSDAAYQGLCEISGNKLRLTRKGLILCNAVIVRLMEYIERPRRA